MGAEGRAGQRAAARYRPRRPSQSVLYRYVQEHLETWLVQCRDGHDDAGPVPAYVEREFRRYLECGIPAHGFARARCRQCGHDFLIAFSCRGREVCQSCSARRMVETAVHLADHVFPPLPVRQWVLAMPTRLRYFLQRDPELQGAALRLFLRAVEQCLRAHSAGAGPAARLGAVAFIHRFGSRHNAHLHFHCVVIDGVFEPAAANAVTFHAATGLEAHAIAQLPQPCAGGCCASSCAVVCSRPTTHRRWRDGNMAVASPSTARCASRPPTAPAVSGCCVTARGHRSPWTDCANSLPNACSMRAPSPVRAATARGPPLWDRPEAATGDGDPYA